MAGYISKFFIADLLNRVDIVEVIDSYVPLRKAGRNFVARCPFHDEKSPSFTVNSDKQMYYCFGCKAGGNVIKFLMDYAHLDFVEAVHELASRLGLEVVYEEGIVPTPVAQRQDLYELVAQVAHYYRQQWKQPTAQKAIDYLKGRGVSGATARDFGLGYAPAGWDHLVKAFHGQHESLREAGFIIKNEEGRLYDRFRDRVMFPIWDQRGRVVAFGGRTLADDNPPKYLNSPETPLFNKSEILYGLHLALKTRLDCIIVVEGYMDVVMLAQHEIRNVVAVLGTAITRENLTHLFRKNISEVIFCMDGDEAGNKAAEKIIKIGLESLVLHSGCTAKLMFLPQGHDPDSFVREQGAAAFLKLAENSNHLSTQLIEMLKQKVDLRNPYGRTQLVELARPFLQPLLDNGLYEKKNTYCRTLLHELSKESLVGMSEIIQRLRSKKQFVPRQTVSKEHPNLVQKAIQLLLYKPVLAQLDINIQKLSQLQEAGINVLLELIAWIRTHPASQQLNTAIICYHWQDKEEYADYIQQLATKEIVLVETEEIEKAFMGALEDLYQFYNEQRLRELTQKPLNELTAMEKQELRALLVDYH